MEQTRSIWCNYLLLLFVNFRIPLVALQVFVLITCYLDSFVQGTLQLPFIVLCPKGMLQPLIMVSFVIECHPPVSPVFIPDATQPP